MRRVAGALCLLLACGSVQAATRVALVSTHRGDSTGTVLDLAEAELSKAPEVELLERSANDRILAEHQLSLSGLVDVNKVMAAGKLLSADLFAVVETDPDGKEALGLVVFEATTGVRLWDAALPAGDVKQAARTAAEGVRAAVKKHSAGLKNLHPLCLLGVRNADLRPEMNSFCDFVALLLERRLIGSDAVVVLERKRLEFVNREKELPTTAPEKELVASLVLVELEVRRGAKGEGLHAQAVLTDGQGKQLDKVVADAGEADADQLAEPLARGISQYLKVAPPSPAADRGGESTRFLREAELMWSHQLMLQGLQAAESAEALDPDHPENQARLAQYLVSYGVYLLDPKGMTTITYGFGLPPRKVETGTLKSSLELALRGVEARYNALRRMPHGDRRALVFDKTRNFNTQQSLGSYVNKLLYIDPGSFDQDARDLLKTFREATGRLILEEIDAWADLAQITPVRPEEIHLKPAPDSAFSQYMWEIKGGFEVITWNAPDSAAYTAMMTKIARRWLEVSRHQDVNTIQIWHLTWFLDSFTSHFSAPFGARWKADPKDAASLLPITEEMEQHPYPLIALYGGGSRLVLRLRIGDLTTAEARKQFHALAQRARDLIREPPAQPADGFRVGCYKWFAHDLEQLRSEIVGLFQLNRKGDPAVTQRELDPLADEFYDFCDFMLGRKEVVEDLVEKVESCGGHDKPYAEKTLALLDRAQALAGSPECRLFDGYLPALGDKLNPIRQRLLAFHPDLASKAGPGKVLPPWDHVLTLLDLNKPGDLQALAAVIVHDNDVYAVGGRPLGSGTQIQLIRLSLNGGEPRFLGKAKITVAPNAVSAMLNRAVTACCIGNDHAYVATAEEGIFAFDLDGGDPRRIGTDDGLPSQAVEQMVFCEGKLYALLGGGYLVALDPRTLHCDVLISTRRKEKTSPFDDSAGSFLVPWLAADPERHRLLFVAYFGEPSTANTTDGLWQYDLKIGQFSQRLRFARNGTVNWGSQERDDHVLISSPFFALWYDLANNKPYLISDNSNPFPPGTSPDAKIHVGGWPPHLMQDGWLWTSYPFQRVSLPDGRKEMLPPLAERPVLSEFSVKYLAPTANPRQIIAADLTHIWRLTLADAPLKGK